MSSHYDVVIVGAGAAGLMAGIWAARTAPNQRILLVDGARKLGAKILVAGGGRCNVTHHAVDAKAYAGASRNAIKKVLRRFDVPRTVAFFEALGVTLKREETGKLFPTTDQARTVLDALLGALDQPNVTLRHPWRVETINREGEGFRVAGPQGAVTAGRVVLATGGKALPRSGSDGHGLVMARALGHRVTDRVFPALVPLVVQDGYFIRDLSGITLPTTLTLQAGSGKKLAAFTNSTLCTHFGLSGPSVLDISRYYLDARHDDPGAVLTLSWLPEATFEEMDARLQALGDATPLSYLRTLLPERLVRALCAAAGIDVGTTGHDLPRDARRALAHLLTATPIPVAGDRGFRYAEVTAGGVPLTELHLATMASRVCPGLYLCGEVCDVDGRIGGFNFQWAWASGFVAGTAVGESVGA